MPYARSGGPVKAEDAPLDPAPPAAMREAVAAIRHLESAVSTAHGIEGVVLRYGWFYGPGTSIAVDPPGPQVQLLRKRQFPIVGGGTGVWSFIHVEERGAGDVGGPSRRACPAPTTWSTTSRRGSPTSCRSSRPAVGAKRPFRVPRWVGRLLAGDVAVMAMTELRGASNDKAKAELGWRLLYPSWRQGFLDGLD